jgi:hypothetical protein
MKTETGLNQRVVSAIERHYNHAKEKHPYFCDHKVPSTFIKEQIPESLSFYREYLEKQTKTNNIHWDAVLTCEMLEIMEAICDNDDAHAVEECYDAIAVLMRVIDVLEGRQELGNPKKGESK